MKLSRLSALFICCFILAAPDLYAQVGNNNPTGPGGEFNGSVTTGGSYDPYTGNATRSLTDMVVAGAVGQYGLASSRVWNTRTGGWQYSHNWGIEVEGDLGQHETYFITFPDGRQETLTYVTTDVDFRAAPGVRERMQPWTATNGDFGVCYLVLPDGGKIEFSGYRTLEFDGELIPPHAWYQFSLTATAMIDPYGQRTTYTANGDGSFQITEPAGRWIKVYYVTSGNAAGRVDYLRASDGREVHYTWQTQYFGIPSLPYVVLTSVNYYGDASLTSTYTYQVGNIGKMGCLLATAYDPMYPGPMKRIAYNYQTTNNPDGSAKVLGQIQSEKSGTTSEIVSTLTVTGADTRVETRADGKQRTFTYAGGYLTNWTDFRNVASSRTYDSNQYVASMTDGRGKRTDFTNNPLTGAVTQIQYPATPDDTTPPSSTGGTVAFTYGWAGCPDFNNRDANNPYYLYSYTDEAGNVTRFTRDTNKRVTQIDYADGGYETFSYNSFGQVLSHRLKTGGMESSTYDGRGLRQTHRRPDNPSGNPTASYQYDTLDRVSGVTNVLGSYPGEPYRTTNYQYNTRGQATVTTLPINPVDGIRHTIIKTYNTNGDGTVTAVTDQLGHVSTYTYDEYRRLRSVMTPLRFPGDSTVRTTYFSYHRSQLNADDYTHTDANVTLLTLPSTNIVKTTYDENYRKSTVTASAASGIDAATTSYGYDNAGNVTSMLVPDEQPGQSNYGKSTIWEYDERNRPMTVKDPINGPLGHYTRYTYDAGGRQKTVTRPNDQSITYDAYDSMNRVLQQTVTQTPQAPAVTKYTYTSSGLQMTMQDPRLVAIGSNYVYRYDYDQMGRRTSVTYPPDFAGANRTELYTYDTTGRLGTYTNRDGKVQTFSYDNLHRQTGFTWSAGSGAPNLAVGYDAADRATSITNANAVISRTYFDDNLLKTETETAAGGTANTTTFACNADGNRESILYPSGKKYRYNYTGRDQLKQVQDNISFVYQAEYVYNVNGNLATRKVGNNLSVITDASVRDALGRCTHLAHQFTGGTRTFDYGYDRMSNRTSIQRDGGTAETYGYDLAQQVTTGVDGGNAHSYGYDANGNRTSLDGGGSYGTNFLNQQTTFNGLTVSYSNPNGNVVSITGAASYIYDAQNRLTSVTNGSTTSTFNYDGLNRKISQTVAGVTTYNVWDGWNLIEERGSGNTLLNSYVYGAGELIERITGTTPYFYYQDGLGSTSHLSDASGTVLEAYKYGTFGQTSVYDPAGGVRKNGSSYDVRHLYTGQLWMPQAGLYDYRNRVYSPTLTRFLQPDPIGFAGDATNPYRYCGNNAVNRRDSSGLVVDEMPVYPMSEPIIVRGSYIPNYDSSFSRDSNGLDFSGGLFGEGNPGEGGVPFGLEPPGGFDLGQLPVNPYSTPAPAPVNPFASPVAAPEPPASTPPAPAPNSPPPNADSYDKNWNGCIQYYRDLATNNMGVTNSNNMPIYNQQEIMNQEISWYANALLYCGPPPIPAYPAPYLEWH